MGRLLAVVLGWTQEAGEKTHTPLEIILYASTTTTLMRLLQPKMVNYWRSRTVCRWAHNAFGRNRFFPTTPTPVSRTPTHFTLHVVMLEYLKLCVCFRRNETDTKRYVRGKSRRKCETGDVVANIHNNTQPTPPTNHPGADGSTPPSPHLVSHHNNVMNMLLSTAPKRFSNMPKNQRNCQRNDEKKPAFTFNRS